MRTDPGRLRGLRGPLLLSACLALLLTGCATMPDSGEIRGVDSSQRADGQVRVFAMPPPDDATPHEVVQGFLEALTSDDPHFDMARKYLASEASRNWQPDSSTTVLSDGPSTDSGRAGDESRGRQDDNGYTYALTGRTVARVDGQRAYTPQSGNYDESLHLSRVKVSDGSTQWRIDRPPTGVVIGESDFQRIYRPAGKYYYADNDSTAGEQVVADPIYVRQRIDPLTQTVDALLDGPTQWLAPGVRTAFPPGTRLSKGAGALQADDQNRVKVPLNKAVDRVGQKQCSRMAAQVLYTIQEVAPAGLEEVELERADGSSLCTLDRDRAEAIAPHRSAVHVRYQYFLDSRQRLVRTAGMNSASGPQPVPGGFGGGDRRFHAVAVSRTEDRAAGTSLDGKSLFVGDLTRGAELGAPVLTSSAGSEEDRLSAPSWDGRGDLWVADRNPKKPRLLSLKEGSGTPREVSVEDLQGTVRSVRVAASGVRVALLVEHKGKTSLQVGRIRKTLNRDGSERLAVLDLRNAAPRMTQVTAMSWAGDARLVVVGREPGGVEQMQYVLCDGSLSLGGTLPSLTGVKSVAAPDEVDGAPLLAHSKDGIVWLSKGGAWRTLEEPGSMPVYPG